MQNVNVSLLWRDDRTRPQRSRGNSKPEAWGSRTDLVAALATLDVNNFTHGCNRCSSLSEGLQKECQANACEEEARRQFEQFAAPHGTYSLGSFKGLS
jgi:hypothetical protein